MKKILKFLMPIALSLGLISTANAENPNGYINGTYVRFRSGPSLSASVYYYLHTGTPLCVNGQCGDWYEVQCDGLTGYVYKDYVVFERPEVYQLSVSEDAQVVNQFVEQTEETPVVTEQKSTEVFNSSIIDTAKQYMGCPYVWGGTTTDGFDCSGFVQYVFRQCGYSISRVAQSQSYDGMEVDFDNVQSGDILCFGSGRYNIYHVGIYIGDGQFIHCSSPEGVIISDLNWYSLELVNIRRIV